MLRINSKSLVAALQEDTTEKVDLLSAQLRELANTPVSPETALKRISSLANSLRDVLKPLDIARRGYSKKIKGTTFKTGLLEVAEAMPLSTKALKALSNLRYDGPLVQRPSGSSYPERLRVETIGDLRKVKYSDFLRIHLCGEKTAEELWWFAAALGVEVPMDVNT